MPPRHLYIKNAITNGVPNIIFAAWNSPVYIWKNITKAWIVSQRTCCCIAVIYIYFSVDPSN
jgi:hypothetical protein